MIQISVVIPAYNEEKYIGECLEALIAQTYPRTAFEIIVVDNNCTDNTAAIARGLGAVVLWEGVKCIAAARQCGAMAAHGDVIASTDADTVVPQDWLERIAARFSADPGLGGLYGPVRHRDGGSLGKVYQAISMPLLMSLTQSMKKPCFSGNNFAVRRDKLMAVGGYNTSMLAGEDIDVSMRMSRITRIAYDPTFVTYTSSRRNTRGCATHPGPHSQQRCAYALLAPIAAASARYSLSASMLC